MCFLGGGGVTARSYWSGTCGQLPFQFSLFRSSLSAIIFFLMNPYPRTDRTMWKFAWAPALRRSVLIVVVLVLSAWTCHAQYTLAIFDTLDVRHDLSKSAIVRFQARKATPPRACMAGARKISAAQRS